MSTHYSLFNEVNRMLDHAILSLIVPADYVLLRSIKFTSLPTHDVYECAVVLKIGTLLRRHDLDSFEAQFKDDKTISNYGVWVCSTGEGLVLRINVIDNYKNIEL